MDNFKYINAGQSTLSASITAGSTTITTANPGRFPTSLSGETLVLTLHPSGLESTQEIVICTAISGGVMTVTRGAQGTTAQAWPSGTVVGAYLTAEMLGQIRDKLMPISGTNTGDETATRIGALINAATEKTTLANADLFGIADSAASNVLKKLSYTNLKVALKAYFDTIYNLYVHPNHSGDVTSVGGGEQTIAANAVTNTKLADMANATIKGRITAGAGDPEDLTATNVRTILNVANGSQKNSDITKAEIEAKLTGAITTHAHIGRNKLINGNFNINQRGYVSGTATTKANQYTLDRWRVVTSGQNLTFVASGNGNSVTAPAGGLEQVIEGINIEGETYVLNWTGTATATVNGTARAKGATFTLTAGANVTVLFSNGTVSLAQLEAGSIVTPFEHRHSGIELALCQRFCQWVPFSLGFNSAGASNAIQTAVMFAVQMRVAPTMATITADPNTTQSVTNNAANVFSYISTIGTLASLSSITAGYSCAIGYRSLAEAEI